MPQTGGGETLSRLGASKESACRLDGPTDGLVECGTCLTIYSFRKLDWDDQQEAPRVFLLQGSYGADAACVFTNDIEAALVGPAPI
jgi:hypothetical protein